MKKRYTEYSGRILKVNLTPEMREAIVAACYRGESQEDIAKRYFITQGFVSFIKGKWDKDNLYGQYTGGGK